jgi:hypothetical protein
MNALLGYDLLFDKVNALLYGHRVQRCESYLVTVSHAIYHLTYYGENGDGTSFADYNLVQQDDIGKAEVYAHFLQQDAPSLQHTGGDIVITDMGEGEEVTVQYNSVASLSQPVKNEAIRLAKDILDKLRIQFAGESLSGVLKSDDLFAVKDLMEGMEKINRVFTHHLENAARLNPTLLEDEDVEVAQKALGVFRYTSAREMVKALEIQLVMSESGQDAALSHALMDRISKAKVELAGMPEEWRGASNTPLKELLDDIETGMDKLTQKMQEMSQAGKDAAGSGRNLGNEDAAAKQAEQGRKNTMDLSQAQSQKQNDAQRQQDQTNANLQRASEMIRSERSAKAAQGAQTQQQQDEQKAQSQQRREQRQQERQEQRSQAQRQDQRTQQRQEQQQQLQAQQQRREQRVQAQQQQEQRANKSIERTIRQLRDAQIQQRQQEQQQANNAANLAKIPPTAAPSVTTPAAPMAAKTPIPMDSIQSLQQSMAAMQNMDVPDALKPNSPARMIKAIAEQRAPEATPQDIPFNVKPNNELSR